MKADPTPPKRVLELAEEVDREIGALPGVRATAKASFRVGGKVFVRLERDAKSVIYGFKLDPARAKAACKQNECARPMRFGGMGAKGWIEVALRYKRDAPLLLQLVRESRELYPS